MRWFSHPADAAHPPTSLDRLEILLVIAIIAILAGMLLPALGKSKERAKRIACLNHLKQLALATLMYADDHENRLPHRGTHFVHWFSREFRDGYHRDYGIQWTMFYCRKVPAAWVRSWRRNQRDH